VLTFCDRTGNCDELVLEQEAFTNKTLVTARPLIDVEGKEVSIPMVSPVKGAALPAPAAHGLPAMTIESLSVPAGRRK